MGVSTPRSGLVQWLRTLGWILNWLRIGVEGSMGPYYWKHRICMRLRRNLKVTKELIGVWHGVFSTVFWCLIFLWYIFKYGGFWRFKIRRTGGTRRDGLGEEEIIGILVAKVVEAFMEAIPELFGSVKTVLIDKFDWRYAAITQIGASTTTSVTITRSQRIEVMQYREFSYMKPP